MNTLYLVIQSVIALGVYVTILLNGRDKLYGWLLGAAIQALQATYGALTAQYGYLLAVVPLVAFLTVFLRKRRERQQPRQLQPLSRPMTDEEFSAFLAKWLKKQDMAVLPREVLYEKGLLNDHNEPA